MYNFLVSFSSTAPGHACITVHTCGTKKHGNKMSGALCVMVFWAKGKRLTNRLPILSLITLSPPGTDRILRVNAPPHAVPISGDPEVFFRFLT